VSRPARSLRAPDPTTRARLLVARQPRPWVGTTPKSKSRHGNKPRPAGGLAPVLTPDEKGHEQDQRNRHQIAAQRIESNLSSSVRVADARCIFRYHGISVHHRVATGKSACDAGGHEWVKI